MLKGTVILNEQETHGNYDFSIKESYMTKGFQNTFGAEANQIAFVAISLIMEKHPNNADYFQTFKYVVDDKETKFWIIYDGEHFTVLLPSEY